MPEVAPLPGEDSPPLPIQDIPGNSRKSKLVSSSVNIRYPGLEVTPSLSLDGYGRNDFDHGDGDDACCDDEFAER